MDGWLKTLIAAACVVVIAGGVYFFLGEYGAHVQRQSEIEQAAADALNKARRKSAEELASSGRCTALAKAITSAQGVLPPDDLNDARACYRYAQLTAFERNSFDLFPEAMKID